MGILLPRLSLSKPGNTTMLRVLSKANSEEFSELGVSQWLHQAAWCRPSHEGPQIKFIDEFFQALQDKSRSKQGSVDQNMALTFQFSNQEHESHANFTNTSKIKNK